MKYFQKFSPECPFKYMSIFFDDVKNIKKVTNCGGLHLTIKRNKKELFLENNSSKGNGYVTCIIFTSKT